MASRKDDRPMPMWKRKVFCTCSRRQKTFSRRRRRKMVPLYLGYAFLFLITVTASVFSFIRWRKKTDPSVAATATSKDPVLPLFCFFKKQLKHPRPSSPGGEEEEGEEEEEEGIEAELIRLHNLPGFPRLLFTIKEETSEDMESDDGGCNSIVSQKGSCSSIKTSLRELLLFSSGATSSPSSPLILNPPSPMKMSNSVSFNVESTPPPKFKFLRDADEKMYMKMVMEEALKLRHQQSIEVTEQHRS